MSRVLRTVDLVAVTAIDDTLMSLGAVRLVRADDVRLIECDVDVVSRLEATLARAGVRVCGAAPMPPTRDLVPTHAPHLSPVAAAGVVDVVDVRPLCIGEATARLLPHRRWTRRRDATVVRSLLRGTDRAFAWRRFVWAPRVALRGRALRGLRPIVFDRDALVRADEEVSLTSDGRLGGWIA